MMTKKLSKHGNSLALVIDRSILELLGIDELDACNVQYGAALKRLAE
jgi:antitoxin component of MazEF toxin-antitoxin module